MARVVKFANQENPDGSGNASTIIVREGGVLLGNVWQIE